MHSNKYLQSWIPSCRRHIFRSDILRLLQVPPSLTGSKGTEWSLLLALPSGCTSFACASGAINYKQYSFGGMLCAFSLSLNILSFILVSAEQLGLHLTKLNFHFPLLQEWEKLLSSQQCPSLLLSASPDPYLPPQAASSSWKQFMHLFFSHACRHGGFISDLWFFQATGHFLQLAKLPWQCSSVRSRKTSCCTSAL